MGRSGHGLAASRTRRVAAAIALAATAALVITALAAPAALGTSQSNASGAQGPAIKLVVAQKVVTAGEIGKNLVFFDPGIWVASYGSAFQLDVKRDSYTTPLTVTQAIKSPAGTTIARRSLPASILSGWNGLKKFLYVTIRNRKGQIVARSDSVFCPDSGDISRTNPGSVRTSNYPTQCASGDPFGIGEVWGIARGWAVDPSSYTIYKLGLGTYKLTESITPTYRRLFNISAGDATATVTLHVVKFSQCCGPITCCAGERAPVPQHFIRETARPAHQTLPSLPAVPTMTRPPVWALPDLIPLPAWSITTSHAKPSGDALDFGATVWVAGHAPLDVEAFRIPGTQTMTAYQYFWENGKLIGRARVGTMGFSGYNSWHFQQFAQYMLLNAKKQVVVRSRKIGFCIAPTDGVDMLLPHATWQPSYTGIAGNCGQPSALWVQELMPLGWGDTYFQYVPYQSFDITNIPNGKYYIEIIANPEHLLYEVTTANDISLREVILGGTTGHRTVRVPAYHGIDPENMGPIATGGVSAGSGSAP
jgi:hypothetical protein